MSDSASKELPVVVVGAGPVGLAAAAHLVERGEDVVVLESGDAAGAAVREWGHVRLFSAWSELVDSAAARLLEATGWKRPAPTGYPTGAEWAMEYLEPLAATLGWRVQYESRVVGVSKRGRDRVVDAGRDEQPFTVHVATADGDRRVVEAKAVIDASGTWSEPSPLGGDGYLAGGEHSAGDVIAYRMPDLADPDVRARYAGRHVVVAGSGHSALTALVALNRLAEEVPDTRVTWVLRRGQIGDTFGSGAADNLPARGALGQRAKAAVEAGRVTVVPGFRTQAVDGGADSGSVTLTSDDGRKIDGVDKVIALTGFRPDLSWLSEVRLDLDNRLHAPQSLAPLIDPNVHSCGTVPPHGVGHLEQPEIGLYLVGMKSYGRAPTFLALTGYEQVRSVVAAIAGDRAAADNVELTLPEAGVCGGSGGYDEGDATEGCCGPVSSVIQIDVPAREMV